MWKRDDAVKPTPPGGTAGTPQIQTTPNVNPAPADQSPAEGGSTFAYPQLAAGQTLTVWFEWSVNPTNPAWRRPETLRLDDGSQTLLTQHSTVTVLP